MPNLQDAKDKVLSKIIEAYDPAQVLVWAKTYAELSLAGQREAITQHIHDTEFYDLDDDDEFAADIFPEDLEREN